MARTPFDDAWLRLIATVAEHGCRKPSRQVGCETISRTGESIRVPIGSWACRPGGALAVEDFPTLTCKALAYRSLAEELAWFLRGDTNAERLAAEGCPIWLADAAKAGERGFDYPPGDLGPIYGKQWRNCKGVDQIAALVEGLAARPYDRGHLVTAWNVVDLPAMVLRPCHFAWQLVCTPCDPTDPAGRRRIDCVVSMRSTDVGLGLPFNVASYALLTVLVACSAAKRLGAPVGDLFQLGEVVVQMADCHIYAPHLAALRALGAPPEAGAPEGEGVRAGMTLVLPPELQGVDQFSAGGCARRAAIWERPPGWTSPPRVELELFV